MSTNRYPFRSVAELDESISSYFGDADVPDGAEKNPKKEQRPPTMSGLAYHLGFDSIQAFEKYEAKSRYASRLKRARLRVEAEYEKKLHYQSSTGAIFALKSMGWTDRLNNGTAGPQEENILKIEVVNSGPGIADNEKDVIL